MFPPGGGSGGGKAALPLEQPGPPWLAEVKIPAHLRRPPRREEIAVAADLDQLLTGDFSVYPLAARRLRTRGEIVIPYLGYAAENDVVARPASKDGEVDDPPTTEAMRIPIALKPILMEIPAEHVGLCFVSPYVTVRVGGAAAAGERHLTKLAPHLVTLLDDPRLEVRHASITALRRISNEFFGYRPDVSASRRRAATAKWRALWGSPATG